MHQVNLILNAWLHMFRVFLTGHQKNADHPVEFARRFIGTGQKHAEHMQPNGNHHGMGGPAMHIPHQHTEWHVVLQVFHIEVGVFPHRPIIEHQDDASDHGGQKQKEGDPSHAPSEFDSQRMAVNFNRMQMQPDITGNLQNPVAGCVGVSMPERGGPYLGFRNLLGNIVPYLAAFDGLHDLGYIWNFRLVGKNKNLRKFS